MSTVVTRSGTLLDLAQPRPESIARTDVARGLSGACRFAGQTDVFFSVAQHSVMVADLVEAFLARDGFPGDRPSGAILIGALHHDSHEAFMGDLPAPLKKLIPEYERIAKRLDRAIHDAIGIRPSVFEAEGWELIHRADMAARCIEAVEVIPGAAKIVLETTEGVTEEDLELAREFWRAPEHSEGARELFAAREETYYRLLCEEVDRADDTMDEEEFSAYLHILRFPLEWFTQGV